MTGVRLEAVLFDMDGTLVDTETEAGEALAAVFDRRYGVALGETALEVVLGASWDDALDTLFAQFDIAEPNPGDLKGALLSEKEARLSAGYRSLPGAKECIRASLTAHATGLVTGSWREEAKHLCARWQIEPAVLVASEDVSEGKPSPEGYLRAARMLGVPSTACLVIEDSTRGVAAGLAAGAVVVYVGAGSMSPEAAANAHVAIDSLEGVDAEGLKRLFDQGRRKPNTPH